MTRPRKVYPFEDLKPGESRLFTEAEYGASELARIVSGVCSRRCADGRQKYSIRSRSTTMKYLWVEVYCMASG